MDTLIIVAVLAAFAVLFIQNRMLKSALPNEQRPSVRKKIRNWREARRHASEATADEDAPSRTQRVRTRARQGARKSRERAASVARGTREKTNGKSILVGAVLLGLIGLNFFQFMQFRAVSEQLEATNERLEAALSGDVDEGDLDPSQSQALVDQIEAQNEELSDQNDELQSRLDELNERIASLEEDDSSTTTASPASVSTESPEAAVAATLSEWGWEDGTYRFDNFTDNPSERGNTSFSPDQLQTHENLVTFLNSDDPRAEAVRSHAREVLSEEEYERFLSGEGHVQVQFDRPAVFEGNTYYVSDTGLVYNSQPREVGSGDMAWMYVSSEGDVVTDVSLRSDCGNVDVPKITPQPDKPEQPDQPDQPDEPDQPDKPDKPDEPESETTKVCRPGVGIITIDVDERRDSDEPVDSPVCQPKECEEGEICGTPNEGGEQQPVQDNDPEDVDAEEGYDDPNREDTDTPGPAEENAESQDEAAECVNQGDCDNHDQTDDGLDGEDVDVPGGEDDQPSDNEDQDQPAGAGGDNPEHDGSEEDTNPDNGTSDPVDTPAQDDDTGEDTIPDATGDENGDADNNTGDPNEDLDLPNVD